MAETKKRPFHGRNGRFGDKTGQAILLVPLCGRLHPLVVMPPCCGAMTESCMEEKFLDIGLWIAFQLFGHIGYAASGNVFAESHSCIALEGIVYVGAVGEDLLRQG